MAYFGVLQSPFEMEEWTAATGGFKPDFPMIFESWSRQRSLDQNFAKALSLGYDKIMVTWEPWTPPPAGLGNTAQGALQPQWSNEAIAAGVHDEYIRTMARAVRTSGLKTVYFRWGHEMNGDWHPWSTTDESYIQAWKHIVNMFRWSGTVQAKFIWAPTAMLSQDGPRFLQAALPYWPGSSYVDYVGLTAINYGPPRDRPAGQFLERFRMMKYVLGKPVISAETNVAYDQRLEFFQGLSDACQENLLSGIVISQPAISRGQANQVTTNNMQWSIVDDPDLMRIVTQLKTNLNASSAV